MSFQVGDKVKCIYRENTVLLTLDKVYTVLEIKRTTTGNKDLLRFVSDIGEIGSFYEDKFVPFNTKELI